MCVSFAFETQRLSGPDINKLRHTEMGPYRYIDIFIDIFMYICI